MGNEAPEGVTTKTILLPRYIYLQRGEFFYNDQIYSGYYLTDDAEIYSNSWHQNRFGEHLADFIEKVKIATGSTQVDLVCHSMGGVVARVAIEGYNQESNVRKLLTLGTPHNPIEGYKATEFGLTIFNEWNAFFNDAPLEWQESGELRELGLDIDFDQNTIEFDVKFTDLTTGETNYFQDIIGYEPTTTEIVSVSGNRSVGAASIQPPNDGFIWNEWSILSNALYNPIIYASHSLSGWNFGFGFNNLTDPELGLTTCSYTEEYIKRWLINDEVREFQGNVNQLSACLEPVGSFYANGEGSQSIRLILDYSGNNFYYDQLTTGCITAYDNNGAFLGSHYANYGDLADSNRPIGSLMGSPVIMMSIPDDYDLASFFNIHLNDMITGQVAELTYQTSLFGIWKAMPEPYVVSSWGGAIAFTVCPYTWESNDINVNTKIYFNNNLLQTVAGSYNSPQGISMLIPPLTSSASFQLCKLRCEYYLDDNGNYVFDESDLLIRTPDWNPDDLVATNDLEGVVVLSWTSDVNPVEGLSYIIYRNDTELTEITNPEQSTFIDESINPGETYTYEIHARYKELESRNDNNTHIFQITTNPANAPNPYPLASFYYNESNIKLKWIDNSERETGYKIKCNSNWIADLTTNEDTITYTYQLPNPDDQEYTFDIYTAVGTNISSSFLRYEIPMLYHTPFYSLNEFDFKNGNNIYLNNDDIYFASERNYCSDVISLESYNGNATNLYFSQFNNSDKQNRIIGSQDNSIYIKTNHEDAIDFLLGYRMVNNELINVNIENLSMLNVKGLDYEFNVLALYRTEESSNTYYLLLSERLTIENLKDDYHDTSELLLVELIDQGTNLLVNNIKGINSIEEARPIYWGNIKELSSGDVVAIYNGELNNNGTISYLGKGIRKINADFTYDVWMHPSNEWISTNKSFFDVGVNQNGEVVILETVDNYDLNLYTYDYPLSGNLGYPSNNELITSGNVKTPRISTVNKAIVYSWCLEDGNSRIGYSVESFNYSITDATLLSKDLIYDYVIEKNYGTGLYELKYIIPDVWAVENERITVNQANIYASKDVLYGYYDEDFMVTVKDNRTHEPLEGISIKVTNNDDFEYYGVTQSDGKFACPLYAESENDITVEIISDFFKAEPITIPVTIYEMTVTMNDEIPVLEYSDISIDIKGELVNEPDAAYLPLTNVNIMIEGIDVNYNGAVTSPGMYESTENTSYTKPINVTITKDKYRTFEGTITPYMWSNVKEATGSNNSNSIVRDPSTGELYMIYTKNNPNPDPYVPTQLTRVIGAYSNNEGEWWYVQDIGYGKNGSIALTQNSEPGTFYDKSIGYVYNTATLPSAITVVNGSVFVEPGSIWNNNLTNYMHSAGIKYLGSLDYPYLLHAMFPHDDPESVLEEILISPEGLSTESQYIVIPAHSPTIALKYNELCPWDDKNDRIIAFEDKNSEICQIIFNTTDLEWNLPERKSFSLSQKSINPCIDVFGEYTDLVWQEGIDEATDEYRIFLNGSRFIGDQTETNKLYPKVKRNSYISYVEDNQNIKVSYFKDDALNTFNLYSGSGLYYADFEVKTTNINSVRTKHTIYYMYTEEEGDIYKIRTGTKEFTTNDLPAPLFELAAADTTDVTGGSPIYEYIGSDNRPIDRITSEVGGLNEDKYYSLSVVSTNNNKNEPYVVMIDGEVSEVVYGKESETIIPIDNQYLDDKSVEVSIDMVKGNPHRTIDMKLYEYDEIENEVEEPANIANTMLQPLIIDKKVITPFSVVNRGINSDGTFKLEVNLPDNDIVELRVYDIMGREVNAKEINMKQGKNILELTNRDKYNNMLSKGIYFIRISSSTESYTGKLVNLK